MKNSAGICINESKSGLRKAVWRNGTKAQRTIDFGPRGAPGTLDTGDRMQLSRAFDRGRIDGLERLVGRRTGMCESSNRTRRRCFRRQFTAEEAHAMACAVCLSLMRAERDARAGTANENGPDDRPADSFETVGAALRRNPVTRRLRSRSPRHRCPDPSARRVPRGSQA